MLVVGVAQLVDAVGVQGRQVDDCSFVRDPCSFPQSVLDPAALAGVLGGLTGGLFTSTLRYLVKIDRYNP
jgi:hypothetical protein